MRERIEDERIPDTIDTSDEIDREIEEDFRHRFIVCKVKIGWKFHPECGTIFVSHDFLEYRTRFLEIIPDLRFPDDIRT